MHKKLIEVKSIKYDKNVMLILAYIIDKCNYTCDYCYNSFPRTNIELNLNKLYDYIYFYKKNTTKNIEIELIGGEPTLHPDLINFCKKCFNWKGIKIKIYTNLTCDTKTYLTLLQYNVQLIMSWHSINNNKLNFDFVKKIQFLTQHYNNMNNFEVRIMYEKNNTQNSIFIFNEINKIIPSDNIEISLLIDKNKISNNVKTTISNYTNEELLNFKSCTNKLNTTNKKCEYKFIYSDNSTELKCFNDLFGMNIVSFKNWLCDSKINNLYIHFDGNVYPCVDYYTKNIKPLFNINYTSTFKIYNKPILCNIKYCTCDWSVRKRLVFK